jgi:Na+/melibiose symporter-like transporter
LEDDGSLGGAFWAKLLGGVVLFGIGLFVVLAIFTKSATRWGIFGTFCVMMLIFIAAGWIYDQRQKKQLAEREAAADLAEARERS